MGLLSGKKKTFVSSVVYNMAGDVKDRADYLKTLTVSRVLRDTSSKKTFARDSLENYLQGPGITLRRFGLWAKTQGYNDNVGVVSSSISVPVDIDSGVLTYELESIYGKAVYLNEVEIGITDYGMWANQYMLANHADKYLLEWAADFDEATQEVILSIPGMAAVRFSPSGYVPRSQYLYASLNQEKNAVSSSTTSAWTEGLIPLLTGYTQYSSDISNEDVALQTTVLVSQSTDGGEPVEQTFVTPTTVPVALTTALYVKRAALPDAPSEIVIGGTTLSIETRDRYEVITTTTVETLTEDLESGLRVSTVTKTVESLRRYTEYRTTTAVVREKAWANEEIFIYRQGSGNLVLDQFFTTQVSAGSFFPIVPIRIDNKFVTHPDYAAILPWVKKAVRRCTDFSFEKLLELVEDNPSLSDIDFAYMIFGVSLNTPEDTAKRYIYQFFQNVGYTSTAEMTQFWIDYEAAIVSWDAWVLWYTTGRHQYKGGSFGGGSVIPTEPVRLPMPTLPKQIITVSTPQNYDIKIKFSGMSEEVIAGKYAPGVHIGNARIYKGTSRTLQTYPEQGTVNNRAGAAVWNSVFGEKITTTIIEWQDTDDSFRRMTITGLTHKNSVYRGKSVDITAWEALDDNEESGFIIPLQEETLRGLPLPVSTQLCTASTYMMFNCYKIVKQKWYQTGVFKIILIVIVIILTIVFPPAGGAAAGGLLGTNVAIGTALGFSGTAALVTGAIANAIVAMVVTQVITRASAAILGDKIGSIIGAILSFVTITVGTNLAGGQPMALSFGNMVSAENLFQLTSSLSNGIASYIQASAVEVQAEIKDVMKDYQEQAKALAEKYMKDFGSGGGIIDPLQVADVMQFKLEDPNLFFNRTLMNGTDIADMSHDMLDNFTNLTLALPLE